MEKIVELKVTIMIGLPFSGKTEKAREIASKKNSVIISYDTIFKKLVNDNPFAGKKAVELVSKTFKSEIKDALDMRLDIVVDDMNLDLKKTQSLKQLISEYEKEWNNSHENSKIKIFILEEVCDFDLSRLVVANINVGHKYSDDQILKLNNSWKLFVDSNKRNFVRIIQDETLEKAIIVDLDGTAFFVSNRNPYASECAETDIPNNAVWYCIKMAFDSGCKILFVSGRRSEHNVFSEKAILNAFNKFKIESNLNLYMRAEGDTRGDEMVKFDIFNSLIKDKYFIQFVLDDRDKVVDLWRLELGLDCFQVNYGNF